MSKTVFIGSGNLATHLSLTLKSQGYQIVQVYSHTLDHAIELSQKLGCSATDEIDNVVTDADCYIFAVKDSVLKELAEKLCPTRQHAIFIHTAGSMPMSVFDGVARHYGVLWPVQTFSKNRPVNFSEVPCVIEGNDDRAVSFIKSLASSISTKVIETNSERRKMLHLAAVLSSNLANHCYRLAERILQAEDIDFSLYAPLIMETARKATEMSPRDAQTGPMVRYDENVMNMQKSLINDERTRQIYQLMAESIHADY